MKFYWSDRNGAPPPPSCQLGIRPFASPLHMFPAKLTPLPQPSQTKAVQKTFLPSKAQWIRQVEQALEKIEEGTLKKVVLARACILDLANAPDPFAITAALSKKSEGAYVYCIQTEKGAFLGATPERLFHRQGSFIQSEALAGTKPRGKTGEEDRRFERELLQSEKEQREFAYIPPYLDEILSPLCKEPLHFYQTTLHKTENVQHLYKRCTGTLKESVLDQEILERLHPTPALCGTPKQEAFKTICTLEPFERGFYGGAIGWSTPDASEWIVAIRSCYLENNRAILYSGTGIIAGSDPEKEWEELDQKIHLYHEIFL